MYRKMLIATLMLGIGMVGFSKTKKDEIKYVNRKEAAKTLAINKQKELLDKMQLCLKNDNEKFNKVPNSDSVKQFLYQDDLVESVLKAKSHSLKHVYDELCKSNKPTDLVYEGLSVGDIEYDKNEEKEIRKGKNPIDSTKLIVPVAFQVHTVAKGNVSDVRYKVTFIWKVKVEEKFENVEGKKVRYFAPKNKLELVSSIAKPIKFLASEQKSMKKAAQDAIVEWYANLPQTLSKQYVEQSLTSIEAMSVSYDEIKMDLPKSKEFTVKDVPAITINIDPYQFIDDDKKSLYTNPVASMTIAPTFKVTVDNTFKNAEVVVSYDKEIHKPITDSAKVERNRMANANVMTFLNQLSEYVSSHDTEQKASIKNMFNTTGSDVEVSYLPKYGNEKIKKESAQKYLSLLKGSALNFTLDNDIEVVDLNWDSLIYTVSQRYQSKTYNDYTQKRIHLVYDADKKTYLINKIEVVPNSTKTE